MCSRVIRATVQAADHIRDTGGPFFIEFRTYRFRAHSMFDPELYRDKAEVDVWRTRDPITTFTDRCANEGVLGAQGVREIEQAAENEVQEAVSFAEAGTWEDIGDLERDVLTPAPRSPR